MAPPKSDKLSKAADAPPPESKAKLSQAAVAITPEAKPKLSKAAVGPTRESKAKLSKAAIELTRESKAKLSKAALALTRDSKPKLSKGAVALPRESKAKLSKAALTTTPELPASTEGTAAENAGTPSGGPPASVDEVNLQDQGPRLSPICATYKVAEEPYPSHHLWFIIRRKKTTIFMSARDDMYIVELKETIESITKVPVSNQRIFKGTTVMKDDMKLYDYGFGQTNKPQNPTLLGLVFKTEEGNWEDLDITPYSPAPELPAFMNKDMFK